MAMKDKYRQSQSVAYLSYVPHMANGDVTVELSQTPEDDLISALELCMEGRLVCPLYGQGRYGVVSPRASDMEAISVLQIQLPQHTIGRQHPQRLPSNTASGVEHGDNHCISEPTRCIPYRERMLWSAHQGDSTPTSASRVG